MRRSREFSLPKKLLALSSITALVVVGLPAGSPINRPGKLPDLGFASLVQSIGGWFAGRAEAEPRQQQQQAPEPPKRVRELAERRTPSLRVFQMSNGQVEAEFSPTPKAFKDAQGRWQDIDRTVREKPRDGYRFVNDTNGFTSLFGDRSDKLARFELGDKRIALGIDRPATGVTPKVEKDKVVYRGAFDGADLEYQVTGDALKERIVLAKAPKDASWRFTLDLAGVSARALPNGAIGFFENPDGPPVFTMPKPFMFDSKNDRKSPHGKVWSDKVTQTVEQQGSKITVTVRADQEWLADRNRRYPVVVDPTIKLQPTPTTGQEVQIWSDTPDRNDGSSYQLSVGTDNFGKARSLIKFDTSVVPAGTALTGAKLRLYYDSELYTDVNSNVHEVRRVTQGWSEDTATWNSVNGAFAEAGLSTATKQARTGNAWHEWDVRNIAQQWVSGSAPNFGLMVKSTDEALGRGGAIYQAAEYAYNGETENTPKLVLTYGRPSADLKAPTTINATGAELNWGAYTDDPNNPNDDLVEYQVHRTVFQAFTPSESTLVTPLAPGTTSFADTTARPTPADSADPFGNAYNYMVAVKTRDGQVLPGPTQLVRLPKAGFTTQVLRGGADDATLSATQPNTNLDTFGGQPWLMAGTGSGTYGKTRALVKFRDLSSLPAGARVVNAEMTLWGFYSVGSGGIFDAHPLTKSFAEGQATWNRASAAAAWTSPGGDTAAATDNVSGITNDPNRHIWDVTATAQGWIDNNASNNGYEIKLRDENAAQRVLFLSDEAAEAHLRPKLTVTYTQPTAAMTYYVPDTPAIRMIPGDEYTIPVTLTNSTTSTWKVADQVVSYRWNLPDLTDVTTPQNRRETALPADVPPGGTVTVQAKVQAPIIADIGNKREQFVLQWDLRNKTRGTWLSGTDRIPALSQNVTVEDPTSNQLGLEKFYSFSGKATGSGSNVLVNHFAGNAVWSYDAFSNPGRGLSSFLRLTYNSMDTSSSSAGQGWSVAASGLTRLGAHLEMHPILLPHPLKVTLPDGDGTSHTFELNKNNSLDPARWTYDSPAGIHLHLQRDGDAEKSRRWKMTRPDRTEFVFDSDGYLTVVRDRNGNEQRFTYAERWSIGLNKPCKYLAYVTDPTGRQTLTLDYWTWGETHNLAIVDKLQSVRDVSGRTVALSYDNKGLLTSFVDGAGSPQAKTFKFGYDVGLGINNVKLVKVTDPRGHETDLAYYNAPLLTSKWRAKTITDRLDFTTDFAYADPDGHNGSEIETTITDAEKRQTKYRTDGYGRPVKTTNAKQQSTDLAWDDGNNVVKLTEDNQAVTTWTYDRKTGYPTTVRDAESVANNWPATTLNYQRSLNGHVAELSSKTSPEGRTWAFGYDARGNLTSVTDPKGVPTPSPDDYKTVYAYDQYGQLQTSTDANENTTTFSDFDPTGYPRKTTDPDSHSSTTVYDVRGNVTSITDPLSKTTTVTYDVFGRPLQTRSPKDQAAGQFITTPPAVYDANDNVTQFTAPNGAVTTAVYDKADRNTSITEPKDTPTSPERTTSLTYDKVGNLKTETQPLGNLTPNIPGDYVIRHDHNEINQLLSSTDADSKKISYDYDRVGNVITVVDARKNATADPNDFASKAEYDLNHRVVKDIDPDGHFSRVGFDRDGNVVSGTDQENVTTTYVLDQREMVEEVRVPHKSGVVRTTRFEYDEAATRPVSSPRAESRPRTIRTTSPPGRCTTSSTGRSSSSPRSTRTTVATGRRTR